MAVTYDKLLGKPRDDTVGFSGTLYDSTDTAVAIVSNGVITSMI